MSMTKRITAALMAALVIFITTYNAYTVEVHATEIVLGGEAAEYLLSLILGIGASYMGKETMERFDLYTLEYDLSEYCKTTEGSSALKLVYPDFKVIDGGGGGSDPEPPEDPDDILDTKIAGIAASKQLFDFVSGFFEYESKLDSSAIGAAINEAENQAVYFVNPVLPDNFFIGFNNSVIPGIAAMNGFDKTLSHVQYYSSDQQSYVASQVDIGVVDLGYEKQYNCLLIQDGGGNNSYELRNGISRYVVNNYSGGISLHGADLPFYYFTLDGSTLYQTGGKIEMVYVTSSHPIYVSPTNDQPVAYWSKGQLYIIYASGSVAVSNVSTVTQPSGVSAAEDALMSVKPIVGMDIASFIKSVGKSITDAHPEEAPVLSQEAINQIYNNVSNVYDNAVTNYYSNPSYIDQSQYITNITNVYEQAIADNPAVDTPSIPSAGLGNLNDYKTIGLSNVFPFCIPFDMYHLISVLEADPTAPSFDYTFNFGEYFDEYTYTVDLSVFDPVAKVFRTTQLILYIFGLILVTRNMIRG